MNDIEDTIVHSHAVTIRFDEHEDGQIEWRLDADEVIDRTMSLSLVEMAEFGAPLSAVGIRALMKACMDGAIYNALETANAIRIAAARRRAADPEQLQQIEPPQDATVN
jgi:ribosomal 50S subunit-associated protein YjgA (DUF615 family)